MPRSSSSVDDSDRIGHEPVSPFRWCRETAITRKNEQNGISIDLAATEAEIGTVVAQLGLGRHLSGPPHGARTSHVRQGLFTGCSNGVDGEIKHSILPNRRAIHERAEAAVANVRARPVRRNLSTKSTVQRSGTMKSEFELTQMMMAELRKHPECTEVDRVLLLHPRSTAPIGTQPSAGALGVSTDDPGMPSAQSLAAFKSGYDVSD